VTGPHLCVLTNGGGVGVPATDAAERLGIPLEFAPGDLQAELRQAMPEFASAKNPVDLSGMAGPKMYDKTVRAALAHPWVHGLAVLYCENSLTTPMEIARSIPEAIQDSGVHGKPVTVAFIGGERSTECLKWFMAGGIPTFETPDKAANAMAALREYARICSMITETLPEPGGRSPEQAREVIAVARAKGRSVLTEVEGAPILAGARQEAPRDRDALVQLIMAYLQMIVDLEDDIAESDANPVFVYEKGKGLKVVDARVILKKK